MKKLIYHNSLTAKYTICPYCKAENSDKWIGTSLDMFGNEHCIFKCNKCNNESQDIEEHKSVKLKAVEWYMNYLNIKPNEKFKCTDEFIKRAEIEYKKKGGKR